MLAVEGEVHGLRNLLTGVAAVSGTALCLQYHALLLGLFVELLVTEAVTVFPVVAAVEESFEGYFMERRELVVEREGVALAFARDIILAYLRFLERHSARLVALDVAELYVVGAGGGYLVRCRCHNAQTVVDETFAPCSSKVEEGFSADERTARARRDIQDTPVGCVLGHQVDGASNGVTVHVGGNHLVHLNALYHVGGDKVELYVAGVVLGRWQAVAVDRYRGKVGRSAAYLSETRLALVVLYVDAADALQGIADVLVGKLTHLYGAHHIGDAHVLLLQLHGTPLSVEGADDLYLGKGGHIAKDEFLVKAAFGDSQRLGHRGKAYVRHGHLVGSGLEIGKFEVSVDIACEDALNAFNGDGSSGQCVVVAVDDAARNDAIDFCLFVGRTVEFSNGCAGHTCFKGDGEAGNEESLVEMHLVCAYLLSFLRLCSYGL